MKKIQISDGVEVYTRSNSNGYGYEICKTTFIEKKPNGFERNRYQTLFQTYDRELLIQLFNEIKETKVVPETWPDTSKEVPPVRVFRFESKHFNYHFNAQTPAMLEKAVRKVLKEESPYWPPNEPKNESSIESIEELEKIGIESLQKEVKEKFNKYQKQLKQYNYNLSDWNNLQLVLEGKGTLGDALDALREYEPDRWEVIDLDIAD